MSTAWSGEWGEEFVPAGTTPPAGQQYRLLWIDPIERQGPWRPEPPSVWDYVLPAPPWRASILIESGVVSEVMTPTQKRANAADSYYRGGTQVVLNSTDPDYALLVAAGYQFEVV